MFEQQYNELARAVDLGERIRALGLAAPGSYAQYSKLSPISEETGVPGDQVTIDPLTQRMQVHEKTA
jgi:starvation-inducible DNA-binding protein